jgi:polyisoprenoid-binding protein YceI
VNTATSVAAGRWVVDLAATRATFAARHLFGPPVPGSIAVTSGTVEVGEDGRPLRLHATLDPASVDTGNPRRDTDLRGKRFLFVDSYPRMEVVADRITVTAGGWSAAATFCARGQEAPLRIDAILEGAVTGPYLDVSAVARLDLRAVGITVPGFLVRRRVDLSVSARLTRAV